MTHNDSPFHLDIVLEQHTPMWHFQPDENGCCLRATEAKPKLDKYIAAKTGNSYQSLDYKMSFEVIETRKRLNTEYFNRNNKPMSCYPIFFGNMGDDTKKKELVYYPNGIRMRLFSLNTKLLKLIKEHLNGFFASTSFGTRQDKGFGCFYPKEKPFVTGDASYRFTMEISSGEWSDSNKLFQGLFNHINFFHKMLRSGVNQQGTYCKSFMYHYAQAEGKRRKQDISWDKPVIRHNFQLTHKAYKYICGLPTYDPKLLDNKNIEPRKELIDNYRALTERKQKIRNQRWLFREALGLSGPQAWMAYRDVITISDANSEEDRITRFQSPLSYHPFFNKNTRCWEVYLILNPIPAEYKDVTFEVSSENQKIWANRNGCQEYKLTGMKIYEDFDLDKYLCFIINNRTSIYKPEGTGGPRGYLDRLFGKANLQALKK